MLNDKEQGQVRFVMVRGVSYLRAEDVAEYIRRLGSTEETDVRTRLNEAASNLAQTGVGTPPC